MVGVLIICMASSAGMITLTLVKPKVQIKDVGIGTYGMVTLLGALLLLAFGFISFKEVFGGLMADVAINPLKILALFISMTVLSIFLDETGFFKFLANAVLKRAGSNQIKLFTAFYVTVSLVTVFTSNDVIILTFTPFICHFAKNAKINPIPYLVSEFVAANTCGMLFIIGNPTNIYLATANGIDFVGYLKVMALPTLFAFIAAYLVMLALFRKKLKEPITGCAQTVTIAQKPLLVIGLFVLSVCTVMLVISSYIRIEMWLIAVLGAAGLTAAALLFCAVRRNKPAALGRTYKRAPWELIPFVISMFVMVLALEKFEVTVRLSELFGNGNPILTYGIASTLVANLVNNIPMSVFFSSVLSNLNPAVAPLGIYAVVIGSNLGAFLTPIGALAGIMWLSILKHNGVEFSFLRFLKYGAVIAVPVLFAALGGLAIAAAWI